MQTEYPDLEIVLWNESKLREELQNDVTGGIRRYWFEQEELSVETMKYQFNKAKFGWFQAKYIPSLHGQGRIHEEMKNILLDYSKLNEWMLLRRDMEVIRSVRQEAAHAMTFFKLQELKMELAGINQYLSRVELSLKQLMGNCEYGTEPKTFSLPERPDLSRTLKRHSYKFINVHIQVRH